MQILISNDDGYTSEGIAHLARAMSALGEVIVVAPDRNKSATSSSLTLYSPLRVSKTEKGWYCVDGTPADCVHLAVTGLLTTTPDIVVSGINIGANLGDDVLYSGTVGAAIEGRHMRLTPLAVSICSPEPRHWATAAHVVSEIVKRLHNQPLNASTVLNINVPDVSLDELKGIKITRCGKRSAPCAAEFMRNHRGSDMYWVGAPGEGEDSSGTDFEAIRLGYASVTPLDVDMSYHAAIPELEAWLS